MKTPLLWKIRRVFLKIIRIFTGHEHGCCNDIFKRCSDCKYVKGEKQC